MRASELEDGFAEMGGRQAEEQHSVRGFLGRMLFSGYGSLKRVNVLSGGERVRCMLSRLMLARPNALIPDEPTNNPDLEAIAALNDCHQLLEIWWR